MKIQRVDDKTVKCFLSKEELEEYQIDYKDFIMRNEKAKEVVQEIIQQAEEEVGYKPPRFAFDLQIMLLPDEGLLLTFSEREPEGAQFMECLKEMKKMLQQTREKLGMTQEGEQNPFQTQEAAEDSREAVREAEPVRKREELPKPEFAVFAFSRLGNIMDYVKGLPANLRIESEMYEMEGIYYLIMKKGHASYSRYSRACIQAMEFGGLYAAEEGQIKLLREHGTCLIAEKAIKKLRG